MASLWAVSVNSWAMLGTAAFFAALVLASSFLRIEGEHAPVAFEAPVVFGAIIIFHDPSLALLIAFSGLLLHALYDAAKRRRGRLEAAGEAAQLAIAYFVVALLYTLAVERHARPMAKVSGYILLLVGYVAFLVLLASMRRWFAGESGAPDLRAILLTHGRTLLLLSPVVAIEVMLWQFQGVAGVAVGFVTVLVVAYAMRSAAEASVLNADLMRRNRELSILTENSTHILSAEDDQETLRRLMTLLSKLAHTKACAVVTWEPTPDTPGSVYRFGECLPSDTEILRWVDAAGFAQSAPSRPFVFHDGQRRFPLSSGSATQVLIGIQTPEVIYGILIFETEDLSILKAGSLNLLTLLVNQTALALQDQLLRREMREKTTQLEAQAGTMATILDVSNSLIGSFDIDGALTRIAHAIRKALGFEIVVFAVLDPKRGEYVRRAHAGLDEVWEEVRKKRVPPAEISEFMNPDFRVSNSYFVSHSSLQQAESDLFVLPEEHGFRLEEEWHENDMLLVPLMGGDQMMGYLSVRKPHDRTVPTADTARTLEIFAAQAVTALQSARQYEEIRRLTFIDALTPAFNHRYFQEALSREIHRHSRGGHEFALAMLDIDNFKRVNDTFGHPIGDEILKGLVGELMSNARDTDVVARYGGEEFAIIFPETPAHAARDAANRMRELVELREFVIPQLDRHLRVTISVGVAVYPLDGVTSADLIARADAALYHAKKNGKNQVVIAADVPGQIAL
jgi:diguanylate cyclase (GGDEF)-like protein